MKTTSFRFNKIYFIESINTTITNHKQLAIGNELLNSLSKRIESLKEQSDEYKDLSCELIEIDGVDSWYKTFEKIEEDCKNDNYPIIHFICHGNYNSKTNEAYMWLADSNNRIIGYTPIQWSEVMYSLEKINIACRNNLLVTMCVCYGFYSLRNLLDIQHRIPFWCLLSKPNPVTLQEGENMLSFYIELIQNRSLDSALKLLHDVSYNDSTEENDKLKFTFSDYLFINIIREEFKRRKDETYLRNEAIKEYNNNKIYMYYELGVFQDMFISSYMSKRNEIYIDIKNKKFMLDIYPEEKNRFDLPESYDDLMNFSQNKEQPL